MSFVIKHRGTRGGFALAEYMCPKHGRFEALVERDEEGNPPATQDCSAMVPAGGVEVEYVECDLPSAWTISAPSVHTQFVVSATQGKSAAKPHNDAMDTRMLAEGRRNDFRKQRKAVKEKRRQQRLKALLE